MPWTVVAGGLARPEGRPDRPCRRARRAATASRSPTWPSSEATIRDYADRHPGPADLALVVEVADSSLREDRKGLARYAWAGIPVAWIVNLNDETVEVYTRPTGPADPAKYEEIKVYQKDDHVPVVVDGREVGRVAVADLLP